MLMSVQNNIAGGESMVLERPAAGGVYASLFEKINLSPVSELSALDIWQDAQAMSDATADERLTAGMQVFLECLTKAGAKVEKLDKSLIDHHIAELDYQISRQLDAVMHHEEFQAVEGLWRGVKSLIDKTDFRQNVKIELLSMSKEDLRQDFEDSPEIIQSGLYKHTYIDEYDTPGGEPIAALISAYEFDASAQDVALLRNISKVSAAAHMPFIGSAGPKFFLKESMEDVAAIKDIGNYFDRAEYIKWKSFRDTDDARYIGLVMPRVLGRLPYGPDTVPVRSFNYVEEVKGPDHDKYLWTNASFAFASNMVRSFINNGWCVQIRGPQAGGAVQDLPIHLYDLGTGNQVKIPSEVMIPETREFEFANLGFIPLSYYKNRDYACFFSANSSQKPALYDTADATANSRINARLPYIFLLSRIAHYLKLIQRENIGTTKDRRLLELELNTWVAASLSPLPVPLSPEQLKTLRQQSSLPKTAIAQTQQQLALLDKLPPDWSMTYSRKLTEQAEMLWPEQAKPLVQQWQQQRNAAALPTEQLNGWHQGMVTLEKLSHRLNGLDEQKGKYMTVSELKSVVFSAMQSFNQSIPAEEQLRRLSQYPAGNVLPEGEKTQLELHLKQLATRYAQIKQDASAQ
ncbi:TPA: type VI secretion system contractile sheath large subunit [Enterobacter kobei]|nr:type VI secretion system contractile sheath large subunit [Enterobacter kobei]